MHAQHSQVVDAVLAGVSYAFESYYGGQPRVLGKCPEVILGMGQADASATVKQGFASIPQQSHGVGEVGAVWLWLCWRLFGHSGCLSKQYVLGDINPNRPRAPTLRQ